MGEEPPKYQVEDILNKKKPPPQILDLNGLMWVATVKKKLILWSFWIRPDLGKKGIQADRAV